MSGAKSLAVQIDAQAKINLALRVLGKSPSGYHPIETLLLRLELRDSLVVRPHACEKSVTVNADVGRSEDNLAFRAAEAFSVATGWPSGWEIEIEKRIPIGAGLGGGSADAGAVLRALNALSPKPLPLAELQLVAATIGADVPFLSCDAAFAFAEGYGEKLTVLAAPVSRAVALAIPDFQISTREAYSWIDSDEAARGDRPQWTVEDLTWGTLDGLAENDFEAVVGRRHGEIGQLVRALESAGARAAGMTGSGAVVFGLFDEDRQIDSVRLPVGAKLLRTRTATRVVQPQPMG